MKYSIQYPVKLVTALIVLMFLFSASSVVAQETTRSTTLKTFDELTDHSRQVETIWVPLYKSHILRINKPVKKISIGNPDIADILIMQSGQLYVLGRGLGTTNVLLWDGKNKLISAFDIEVTHDLDTLKAKLFELLPEENIEVHSSQGAIVLNGEVSSLTRMNTAVEIAKSFTVPTKDDAEDNAISSVVNLMGVGGAQQVMLKVTVAEVSRRVARRLGIKFNAVNSGSNFQFGAVSGGATFPDAVFTDVAAGATGARTPLFTDGGIFGPAIDEFAPGDLSIADKGLFASYIGGDYLFSMALDAAKEDGSAKILAEPTLTTLTGQEASFLSGGEFPIPVPNEDGITIDFKEFGIGLKFLPVVLDSQRINMKLNISVSELTSAASVSASPGNTSASFFVPALTKRSASSTVELADGQTIGIAGLLNENMREVVNKFPGLGDIPVLGNLFRSQEFEKGETELVILVTPQLAKPLNTDEIALPTDNFVEPSDYEFYILGKNLGDPEVKSESSQQVASASDSAPLNEAIADHEEDKTPVPATSFAVPPLPKINGTSGGMENNYGHSIN